MHVHVHSEAMTGACILLAGGGVTKTVSVLWKYLPSPLVLGNAEYIPRDWGRGGDVILQGDHIGDYSIGPE